VTLHGAAPEETNLALFQSCGVFVQHSITDPETGDEVGLPAAIQEAKAHGMAVVSTRHSGIAEAVDEGVTGFLASECDLQAMARAMLDAAKMPLPRGRTLPVPQRPPNAIPGQRTNAATAFSGSWQ
jgi:glycosyltransferase involved in cell wall biosynthesis